MLRGPDVTKGLEEKVGWISTTFQPDPPPHPNLSGCPFSLRPLSPARWPLQTGSSNKSPGRLDAVQQHRHVLLTDYRRSNMMHRVTSVSLLLAGGGGNSLFSTPCHWSPSLVLQPPCSSSAHSVPNSEDGIKFKETNKENRRFCVWVFVCFYPRSDDVRCARGCMSGWWVCGCSTVWTSL